MRQDSGKHRFEYYGRERHPTLKLKNKVVWKNENISTGLTFTIGEPSSLGLGLDFQETDVSKTKGISLERRATAHGRSVDLGAFPFLDEEGRRYRDIDLKGTGARIRSWGFGVESWYVDTKHGEQRVMGLMNKADALHDSEIAEIFTNLGIRTHRSLAIIELEELPVAKPDSPTVVQTVASLKKEGKLPEAFIPVIQVRAYGTKSRLMDILSDFKEVEDAISLVSEETAGMVTDFSSYLEWFAKTLGTNVGRMHKNGYVHRFLSVHNITTDCRLVDFDSVEKRPEDEPNPVIPEFDSVDDKHNALPVSSPFWNEVSKDERDAEESFEGFLVHLGRVFPKEMEGISVRSLLVSYEDAYVKENPDAVLFLRKYQKNIRIRKDV